MVCFLLWTLQLYGLIGMYISVPNLNSAYLQNITLDVVANFFNIPLERDEEISTGIYIAKPVRGACCSQRIEDPNSIFVNAYVCGSQGPLKPLVQLIQHVLNECGQKLVERNYEDFGAFVVANLRAGKSCGGSKRFGSRMMRTCSLRIECC